ncbi:hypothetical protein EB796_008476 [Bugula neritina]|uniref:Uncharacterized protein n=1 Tax=Bugula neritina TaxID=10212 RepID=A0A7J7K4Y9_BUGNE|nr:hypothetical protein EB796_008476 [Bugula neritina]
MSMAPDSLHLPSSFEEIQATIHPTSTELEGIEDLLNRDLDAQVSELSRFISPELHSRTYEQDIQSSDPQTSVRTPDMQSVKIANYAATHGGLSTETSLEEVLRTSPVSDPIEQQPNSQTQELNVQFCDSDTSTVNQSHFTLPGFSTEPTHSQTSSSTLQDQTFNEQADVTYSTPSSSRSEATDSSAFTILNGKLLTYS